MKGQFLKHRQIPRLIGVPAPLVVDQAVVDGVDGDGLAVAALGRGDLLVGLYAVFVLQHTSDGCVKATVENPRDSVEKLFPKECPGCLHCPFSTVKASEGLS